MNWLKLKAGAAKTRFDELDPAECVDMGDWPSEYQELRALIASAISLFSDSASSKFAYDLEMGLCLYRILGNAGFDLRSAADDAIWRHLSLVILPDYVHARWESLNEDRFWKSRSRIWLRAVWWFVHLAWQGDELSTRTAVNGMTTDSMVQIVERPGKNGFRIDLYRAIIRESGVRMIDEDHFRRLQKLNTARLVMIEPGLHPGGVDGYVKELIIRLDLDIDGKKIGKEHRSEHVG